MGSWDVGQRSLFDVRKGVLRIGLSSKARVKVITADPAGKEQQQQEDPASAAFALDDGFADFVKVVFGVVGQDRSGSDPRESRRSVGEGKRLTLGREDRRRRWGSGRDNMGAQLGGWCRGRGSAGLGDGADGVIELRRSNGRGGSRSNPRGSRRRGGGSGSNPRGSRRRCRSGGRHGMRGGLKRAATCDGDLRNRSRG